LRVAATPIGFQVWLGEGYACRSLWLVDAAGRRSALPIADLQSGQAIDMTSLAAGVYSIAGETTEGQALHARAVWLP
jgi:hypothetical protein